jgi:hypothetical protein
MNIENRIWIQEIKDCTSFQYSFRYFFINFPPILKVEMSQFNTNSKMRQLGFIPIAVWLSGMPHKKGLLRHFNFQKLCAWHVCGTCHTKSGLANYKINNFWEDDKILQGVSCKLFKSSCYPCCIFRALQ